MQRNSAVTLAEQMIKLQNNSLAVIGAMSESVSSVEDSIILKTEDLQGNVVTQTFKTIGYVEGELARLAQMIDTLTNVDQKGAIIQTSKQGKRLIVSDLNREPAPISEVAQVNSFLVENNHFFDSLLNPLLKIRLNLNGKIEGSVRSILSRRYIVSFKLDAQGAFTQSGVAAKSLFEEQFKNRTNVDLGQLEKWILNTPGIRPNKNGNKVTYDEQEFTLEPNRLLHEGFFTIVSADEDSISRKLWYFLNTLDYFEIETGNKQVLKVGDEVIVNTAYSTTRYRIIDINRDSSDVKVRFETIEGNEAPPVGIVAGLKFYSTLVDDKKVDISIGFNEYNVIFIKPINTDNYLVARKWSKGVGFFSNDLKLSSDSNNGDNGRGMTDYYITTVSDFGEYLKDVVDRQIPRNLGIKPVAPTLSGSNFRVVQVNKHLTDTPDLEKNRKRHESISSLRSQLDELSKTISNKRKEQYSKSVKNPKDRISIENQVNKLVQESDSVSTSISSAVTDILTNVQNDNTATPKFKLQGFWNIPAQLISDKTRPQSIIGFRVHCKYSSKSGQENTNEVFKVTNEDGTITNAAFSQWITVPSGIRERLYDEVTQQWIWAPEDLSNIDKPNVNSISVSISPNEKIEIRVKSISEVGYPDSLLESEWSAPLTISFPVELLAGRNPQEIITKNAELENLKLQLISELERRNLNQHLNDGISIGNVYYAHDAKNIGYLDGNDYVSLADKIKRIETSEVITQSNDIALSADWVNFGGEYELARYYRHEGKVYLAGVVRVEVASGDSIVDRFPSQPVSAVQNNEHYLIGVLPADYCPAKTMVFTVATGDSQFARIDISADGSIKLVNGQTDFVSLNGIMFKIENNIQ